MTDRRDAILDYLDGQMDDAQQAELRDWLDQSPEHWEQFARLSFLHGALGTQLRNEESVTAFRIDSLQALRSLPPDPEPTFKTVGHALAYILEQTVTPRRLAAVATAAVFLLAATLFVIFRGDSTPAANPAPPVIAQSPEAATDPGPAPDQTYPVATLSATHNAQWAEGALAPGSKLHPNQRLTLTAGFAEITTARGAIAIIEAPAIIELTNSNNAIHLHTGRLVGICESESSKGFLVRTPNMDITDLGTRFGVDATKTAATEVHVFEGTVNASLPNARGDSESSRLLTAGGAVTAEAGTTVLSDIKLDSTRFTALQIDPHAPALADAAAAAGIKRIVGGLRWSPMAPRLLDSRFELEDGQDAYIYTELQGHRLGSDIPVSIHQTGTTRDFKTFEAKTIPAGTRIRTYLVCLNGGSSGGRNHVTSTASVSFEGEILGLIANVDDWQTFEERLVGETDAFFRFTRQGLGPLLESEDSEVSSDEIYISEDRHTLAMYLRGSDFAEFVRVIVREPIQEK